MSLDDGESKILLNRIDERVAALKEGGERQRQEIEELKSLRSKVEYLMSDDYANVRRIIQDEIRVANEKRGIRYIDLAGILLAGIAVLVSIWAKSG